MCRTFSEKRATKSIMLHVKKFTRGGHATKLKIKFELLKMCTQRKAIIFSKCVHYK